MSEITRNPSALKTWRPGEPVDHRFLNQTNRAVESLRHGVNPPKQLSGKGAATGAAMFQLVSVHGDYVLAAEFDGVTAGTLSIPVAKPWLLRRTPFDGESRDGITYTYGGSASREGVDDDTSETETQLVVPSYVVGDVLFAIRTLRGTGVTWSPVAGVTDPVLWLDLNIDARAWAKDSE
jgi:hypothetical protein